MNLCTRQLTGENNGHLESPGYPPNPVDFGLKDENPPHAVVAGQAKRDPVRSKYSPTGRCLRVFCYRTPMV